MNSFGKNIRISIFGESHGSVIGLTIDGLPANFTFDEKKIDAALLRRQGQLDISTPRQEKNNWQFISGYFESHTTGAPLTILVSNEDINSTTYEAGKIRPSHSDFTHFIKYMGANDYRGGGHTSGRITVVFAVLGEICRQILSSKNITIISRISSLKDIYDKKLSYEEITLENLCSLEEDYFPVVDTRAKNAMYSLIKKATKNHDAIGGTIETFVFHTPLGLGEPFFDSFESVLSHLLFSIPGIKGIEFGDGFEMTTKYASSIVDEMRYQGDKVHFMSNHQGGINGGVTNGNPVQFKVAVRAPSSIASPLQSIDILKKENIEVSTTGRHDPIIVHRILPIIQGLTYYTILDMVYENER